MIVVSCNPFIVIFGALLQYCFSIKIEESRFSESSSIEDVHNLPFVTYEVENF